MKGIHFDVEKDGFYGTLTTLWQNVVQNFSEGMRADENRY